MSSETICKYESEDGYLWEVKKLNDYELRIAFHDGIGWNYVDVPEQLIEKIMQHKMEKMQKKRR